MSVKQFPILFLLGILFFGACSDEDAKPVEAFFCPDGNHPHKIDLGLPSGILWSCCNVGASLPIEYGGFYSLGETSEKRNYSYSNFKFYVDNGRTDYLDPKGDISCTKYDVATVRMGMPWCIPDTIFAKELLSFCTWEWTEVQEVQGMKVTGPNGNSIFFPACGLKFGSRHEGDGSFGVYWTSTECPTGKYYVDNAYSFYFRRKSQPSTNDYLRSNGHSVRPIYDNTRVRPQNGR